MSDEPTTSRAWAEVDLSAITRNVARLREMIGPAPRIMAVAKADAYGHGASEVARVVLQADSGAWFGVATADEAVRLRSAARDAPIAVLSACLPSDADGLVEARTTPVVSDCAMVDALDLAASRLACSVDVHIEVDSGMGRCGVRPDAVARLVEAVLGTRCVRLRGLMTHFPDAENDPRGTSEQVRILRAVHADLRARGVGPLILHAANSAGLLQCPESALDMIRPGLLLYGLWPPVPGSAATGGLTAALALKARVLLIRDMPRHHSISYGRTHKLHRASRVAVVSVGYADGYPRALSGRAEALIRGRRAPLLGRVCMDTTMFDVTDVPEAAVGDEAVLFGSQGGECIRPESLAQTIGATEHEITCGLSPRVPRLYCVC